MQALDIFVGGRHILGRPEDPSRPWGLFVQKDGFQGWGGIPAGRRESLARAVQHGEHDAPVYFPSRVVTIDGWAIERTPYQLVYLLSGVAGLAAEGINRVTVAQWGDTEWADGRRILAAADPVGVSGGANLHAPFQMQFVFADPRKYGDVNRQPETGTATSIPVFHRGNFPAYPVIEIPNAPAAYTIASSLGVFTVSGATAGGTHTVNLRSARVYRNGVEMPDVGHGDLWTVPPGMPMVHTLSVAGSVTIPDTFI